jgi:peptide deformylase
MNGGGGANNSHHQHHARHTLPPPSSLPPLFPEELEDLAPPSSSFVIDHTKDEEEEEDEEEEDNDRRRRKSPPPTPTPAPATTPAPAHTPMWILKFVLILFITSLASSVATRMWLSNASLLVAAEEVLWKREGMRKHHHHHHNVYPLRVDPPPHATKSEPLLHSDPGARPLLASLEASFRAHAGTTTAACLCMHHLRAPLGGVQKRVCAIYNGEQMYLMVNPTLAGRSNATDAYREHSVSCAPASVQHHKRARIIFLEWTDPSVGFTEMYARFQGLPAVCMQLALDELDGNEHCRV